MARLKPAIPDDEVSKYGVAEIRKKYKELSATYNKFLNGELFYCHKCNEYKVATAFYNDKTNASGLFHECKECLLDEATDFDKKQMIRVDNRKKTIDVFRKMNLPFYDYLYKNSLRQVQEKTGEKNRSTAYQHMLTQVKSLDQYKDKTFINSDFDDEEGDGVDSEIKLNQKTIKAAKKRFGLGYSSEDYMILENEYQDWVCRYECNQKAQEEVFENLAMLKLLKRKALIKGESTKDLDKQQQDWLDTGKLKPKQISSDSITDVQSFGTMLQKFEETKPLPEIDPELKDVDKIGLYIEVFFRGHLSKLFGLKNPFTYIYEKIMKKYTVERPHYDEDEDSEAVFEKVFGTATDE